MSSGPDSKVETYYQAWIDSLGLLLSRMAEAEWKTDADAVPADYAPAVCLRVTATGGLSGQQWLTFAAADINALLGIFLGEEVTIAGELDETQREAIEELIRQWAGLAATALKADFGEVTLQVALELPPDHVSNLSRLLRAADSTRSIAARLELDASLADALNQSAIAPQVEPDNHAAAGPAAAGPTAAGPTATDQSPEAVSPPVSLPPPSGARIEELLRQGNLELLMDVELPVMLRFGSREATLQEVLDLATGAVLELDREIREPVDLVLNQRVIARGEVVVVDGNYGLRVLDVASPQQRVNSL